MKEAAKKAIDFFVEQGWQVEQACGIVANLILESDLSTACVGDGGLARGVAQWHPDRQNLIAAHFRKPLSRMTLVEQLAAVHWELTDGQEKRAGERIREAMTADEAGQLVSRFYERPRRVQWEADRRGALADDLFGELGKEG